MPVVGGVTNSQVNVPPSGSVPGNVPVTGTSTTVAKVTALVVGGSSTGVKVMSEEAAALGSIPSETVTVTVGDRRAELTASPEVGRSLLAALRCAHAQTVRAFVLELRAALEAP